MNSISSRGVYGLAAMHVLSRSRDQKPMQVKEIAAMTSISHSYLEQILASLRKAGLVQSIRGAHGGYRLSRPAHEVSVLVIIEALEGTLWKIEGNVGSSVILEYFWQDVHEKMRKLLTLKLSELDQAFQPYHYQI
ncbi:MAG: Rrf2 family transcriptional regulator [Campylobacterota bacterium]|nr:Rrf2 family transcriptional regulator [Campylobacterota bacterium]